jgi:hypothetical protein
MASLRTCLECGGWVSSQASRCPHCTTLYPCGVKCTVCCKFLKRSEALKITKEYGGAENRVDTKFFHYSCHHQVSQIRLGRARTSCPVCKSAIEFDTSSFAGCPKCGHTFATKLEDPSFTPCYYCGFRLNKNLEVKVKEVSRPFLDHWITEPIYAHKICYTQEREEQEQKLKTQEYLESVKVQKQRLEQINRKKTRRNKETLALSIGLGLALGIIFGGLGGLTSHLVFGFGTSFQSAALFGFYCVFILTVAAVWILSFLE